MVKFTGNFFMPLEFGCVVQISGRTTREAIDFAINFYNEKDSYEIPLHINFIFGKYAQILRCSKINGLFGSEENSPGMLTKEHNPIKPGEDFNLYIFVGMDRFHLSINNIHYCDYIFRTSIKRITGVQVLNDVEKIFEFDHRRVFPFAFPTYQTRLLANVAFSNDNPAPFKQGNIMVIKGSTGGNPNGGFTMKFLVGKTERQAFHFDVRFSVKKVLRNHSLNDDGELLLSEAEDYGMFPFEYEKLFKIAIGFEKTGLLIAVNGKFFCEYPYTTKLSWYSGLKIREKNDLVLNILEVKHYKTSVDLPHFDTFSKI